MKPTPMWYAVYTRPRWEKKVAELLKHKGIQHYCPLNRVLHQWHDRKKWVEQPLFTSYVFVYVTQAEQAEVRKTDGVLNFVYWLSKPAVIRGEEIEAIKDFLYRHQSVEAEKTPVQLQDQVRIISGPLMQREGTVVEVRNKTIKILLPSLGYALVATVEKERLEVLTPTAAVGVRKEPNSTAAYPTSHFPK